MRDTSAKTGASEVGEAGKVGEASSPLHHGIVPINTTCRSGELASPACSTRTEAKRGQAP